MAGLVKVLSIAVGWSSFVALTNHLNNMGALFPAAGMCFALAWVIWRFAQWLDR